MIPLNHDTYKLLLKANLDANEVVRNAETRDWYELTYDIFKKAPLNDLRDLWRIVAFTYSWMPTIPDIKAHLIKEPEELVNKLQNLKNGDDSCLPKLLEQLIPVINNSLVGVSKVLHFISADIVPIIDRNVLRGWDAFFFKLHPEFQVTQLPNYKTTLNGNHITKYLNYRDVLKRWVQNSSGQITLRDLEFAFFELGKTYVDDRIEHPTYKFE